MACVLGGPSALSPHVLSLMSGWAIMLASYPPGGDTSIRRIQQQDSRAPAPGPSSYASKPISAQDDICPCSRHYDGRGRA